MSNDDKTGIRDFADKANKVTEKVAREATDHAAAAAKGVTEAYGEAWDVTRRQATELRKKVVAHAQEEPVNALVMSVAAGLAIGFIYGATRS